MNALSTVFLVGTICFTGNAAQAATPAQVTPTSTAITATKSVNTTVKSKVKKSKKAKKAKKFFSKCHRSKRFNERRVAFGTSAILGGRCVTSKVKGVRLVSSYPGHQPSAGRAIDVMINRSGSCSAGREAGNKVARYFMNNSGKHRVQYVIWKNNIWQTYEKRRNPSNWRSMHRGGSCTTRHYDHVHISFK